jgi:hypothetical protein
MRHHGNFIICRNTFTQQLTVDFHDLLTFSDILDENIQPSLKLQPIHGTYWKRLRLICDQTTIKL